MIQLYDEAILDWLTGSFNDEVKIVPVADYWRVIAMYKEQQLQLPAICISRNNQSIDTELKSWTMSRMGLVDKVSNHRLVTEQSLPLLLNYNLTLLATKQDDIDELTSEVIFLIINKPRIAITIPYGSEHDVFANVDIDGQVQDSSLRDTFSDTGILYQSIIPIKVIGANVFNIENRRLRYLRTELRISKNPTKEVIENAKDKHP